MRTLRFRACAAALSATLVGLTIAPVAAQADHWRYRRHYYGGHHHGGGTAAAIAGLGVLGVIAGEAAANSARRECDLQRERYRDSRGVLRVRTVKVCD